jgi:RNA ligase
MNFYKYIGCTPEQFEMGYLDTRLVNFQMHPEFPLVIYTYGRKTVHEQAWDSVTTKCRGIIVNRDTQEIVARPFEKFFNLGTESMPETDPSTWRPNGDSADWLSRQPTVWDKVDGFLCTVYIWEGVPYAASKGSFTSPHAKWATNWIQNNTLLKVWPTAVTAVFEGICPEMRIVVDYKDARQLVLLGVVNNETGEELDAAKLKLWADHAGVVMAQQHFMTWQSAQQMSYDETVKNTEGYVLTWYRKGETPFRLKVKYIDYLRIHRMVTGLSPKRILEALQNGWTSVLDEWTNDSTPWFNHFVAKWRRVIETEAMRLEKNAKEIYADAREANRIKVGQAPYANMGEERKAYAQEFTRPEDKEYSGILFAMLDGKDWQQVIWKKIKESAVMKGGQPLVDSHQI